MNSQGPADTFEIVYEPTAGTAFIYRSIHAGICGPMTTRVHVCHRAAAEAEALRHGLLRSGPWTVAGSGHEHAAAERATL